MYLSWRSQRSAPSTVCVLQLICCAATTTSSTYNQAHASSALCTIASICTMMQQVSLLLLAVLASASLTHQASAQLNGQANSTEGEVAFAAPPAPEGGADSAQPAACEAPCYVVGDRWPYRNCKAECDPDVCNRGEALGAFKRASRTALRRQNTETSSC